MQSAHCQMRVNNALKKIEGSRVLSVQPGFAEVEIENVNLQKEIITTTENAGYKVSGIEAESSVTSKDGNTLQFKTNINCSGCVAKVTNEFNGTSGIESWDVDLLNKDRILTINSGGISEQEVIKAVEKAGFTIKPIK